MTTYKNLNSLHFVYHSSVGPMADALMNKLCAKKATIHQVTTMLATSRNVLFPGHSHLITIGTDDQTL